MPRVSVVIPAYDVAAFVARAVGSVLAQTWSDRELIVVDDGSSDDTVAVLARFGGAVRTLRQANAGPAAARNHGLARVVDAQGLTVGDWPRASCAEPMPHALFMNGSPVTGSCSGVMARRALVQELGGFDVNLRGFEDPDLWIRLAGRAGYACSAQPLTVVVRMSGSVSSHLPNIRLTMLASLRKSRTLLPLPQGGAFWRAACAGALTDYAKTARQAGRPPQRAGMDPRGCGPRAVGPRAVGDGPAGGHAARRATVTSVPGCPRERT